MNGISKEEDKLAILQESKIDGELKHDNIANVRGVYTNNGKLHIIKDYFPNGTLLDKISNQLQLQKEVQ